MTNHTTHFEASEGGLALSTAILLYRPEASRQGRTYETPQPTASAFASIHPVEPDGNGQPTIGAGSPLTRAHLRQWAKALGRAAPPEILPENVLVSHPDLLAWWVPAQVRSGYFALTSSDELKTLSKRVVVQVPFPAHLFIATRSNLSVYALARSERPTADTEVLHSPILNVYVDGKLCWGNIPKPKTLTAAAIPAYEQAVFDSWSTHPNPGQDTTVTGRGGLVEIWDDLAERGARTFPTRRLRPFNPNYRGQRTGARKGTQIRTTLRSLIETEARR